jgi:hypothetical protein
MLDLEGLGRAQNKPSLQGPRCLHTISPRAESWLLPKGTTFFLS